MDQSVVSNIMKELDPTRPEVAKNQVAAYSPFCDAMFVDREISHFAVQRKLKKELAKNALLFSFRENGRVEFINYLQSFEANSPKEHLQLIQEVYGPDWVSPLD